MVMPTTQSRGKNFYFLWHIFVRRTSNRSKQTDVLRARVTPREEVIHSGPTGGTLLDLPMVI